MSLVKIPNPNPSTVQTRFVHVAPPVAKLIVGGDSIVLGPPQMSFASSLHSPPLRKTSNKDASLPSVRNRPSPPHDNLTLSTSPPEEDEEAGWNKVRSAPRGAHSSRGLERRGGRAERKGGRDTFELPPPKSTSFRNYKEGESQNWRSERTELQSSEQRNGRREERADFLSEEEFGGGGGGDGKEHSAAEFQAWITKMRGGNVKAEETTDAHNDGAHHNGTSNGSDLQKRSLIEEQPKIDKSKIDVDSLFALDTPTLDESASTAPPSSVFFDSAHTTGRASRFRQLFAQDPQQPQTAPQNPEMRQNVDRLRGNPMFSSDPKPGASPDKDDREGFQRIMAMLGGDKNSNMSNVNVSLTMLISAHRKGSATATATTATYARASRRFQGRFLSTSPSAGTDHGTESTPTLHKPHNVHEPTYQRPNRPTPPITR
jgi:hypothetical protein